ncbi:dephospho-CoA kinase [Macrococcus equi]|uniref:dephospho-CoA kinase n=1 Tax=Macrococcus equi TaxID=3395462 RepID=UPI0039BDC5FA
MTVIGLTGGIASGKSTVAKYLSDQGFVIIDADIASRKAVEVGTEGLAQIKKAFGDQVIRLDGSLDRKALGNIIFNDSSEREKLNKIVHPRVRDIMENEKQNALMQGKIVVMDIPLLYENHLEYTVDEVWLVYIPLNIQIERLMLRNNLSQKEAQARIASQMSLEEKKEKADKVIDNSGSIDALHEQLRCLIQPYK